MSEDQIERAVQLRMDRLDRVYLNSQMTEAQYQAEIRRIDQWAAQQRRAA